MEKLDVEYLYMATEGMPEDKAEEMAQLIERARKLQSSAKEDKEPTPKMQKPYLLLTAEPLKEPILGWIIQKEPELVAARNENSEIEEGIEPMCWGDLEVSERIQKVADYINDTPKLRKKNGALTCVGDVMEYAPKRICKENGFTVKTKEPVAIIPVEWLAKPVEESAGEEYGEEDDFAE